MIFYFSGTGNSEYAARKIAEKTGDGAVSMAQCIKNGKKNFYLSSGDTLGFVFPIYAWNVPRIVADFVDGLTLDNYSGQYAYAIFTCGSSVGIACDNLRRALAGKGVSLQFARDLVMPDNYIVAFAPAEPDKQRAVLAAADETLGEIAASISRKERSITIATKGPSRFSARLMSSLFNRYMLGTRKFRTSGSCRSCGVCADICPSGAITIVDGTPTWQEKTCAKCMGCINRCPSGTVEYGKATVGRRYLHPIYQKQDLG